MELTIPITAGLIFLGRTLLPKKVDRNTNKRQTVDDHLNPTNIYKSNVTKDIKRHERQILDKRFENSKNPGKTGIINSGFITQDCGFDCAEKEPVYAHPSMLPIVTPLQAETDASKFSPIFETPGYLSKNHANTLSGEHFKITHNNMQPYFKGSLKQNMNDNAYSATLERFTGVSSLQGKTENDNGYASYKKETENLFDLQQQQVAPGVFELDKSRYFTSTNKPFSIPFPQVRELPIVADIIRPVEKTIDELRILPRKIVENVVNHGLKGRKTNNDYIESNPRDRAIRDDRYGHRYADSKKHKLNGEVDACNKPELTEHSYIGNAVPRNHIQYADPDVYAAGVTRQVDKSRIQGNETIRNLKTITKPGEASRTNMDMFETQRETTNTYATGAPSRTGLGVKLYSNITAPTTLKEGNLFDYTGNYQGHSKAKSREFKHTNNTKREAENQENLPQGVKIKNQTVNALLKEYVNTARKEHGGTQRSYVKPQNVGLANKESIATDRNTSDITSALRTNEFSLAFRKKQ